MAGKKEIKCGNLQCTICYNDIPKIEENLSEDEEVI
jgi:hypothetical protein